MPTVKNVGEPCAGEPHARIDGWREETRPVGSARAAGAPPVYPTSLARDGSYVADVRSSTFVPGSISWQLHFTISGGRMIGGALRHPDGEQITALPEARLGEGCSFGRGAP